MANQPISTIIQDSNKIESDKAKSKHHKFTIQSIPNLKLIENEIKNGPQHCYQLDCSF